MKELIFISVTLLAGAICFLVFLTLLAIIVAPQFTAAFLLTVMIVGPLSTLEY